MPHPPVIETVVQSLRSYAPNRDARESVVVDVGEDGRRLVTIRLEGDVLARVTGDTSSGRGQHRCRVQLLDGKVVSSEATGVPPSGTGRVVRALLVCHQEQALQVTPDEVIAAYDEDVRAHQTPEMDTVRYVAEDLQGEAWLEVVAHGYRLGYDLDGRDGTGRRLLWVAFQEYHDRLRRELGLDPSVGGYEPILG
jgi:hypothetical protein